MPARKLRDREELFKKELIDELRRVEALVRQAPSMEKKAYYFSAAYGITNRTYRYSFSKEVLVADLLLTGVYNMIMERLNAIKSGNQNVIPEPLVFEKICDGIRDLANCIESNESIFEPLGNIAMAGFSVTGAGNYLKEKGELRL
jgi:hypothetical protein